MLKITVPGAEMWNETTQEFVSVKTHELALEHSLVSLSKWESKWCKPFITQAKKTEEEILDYIRCMTITQNVDPNVYLCLTEDNIKAIMEYIQAPMTATTFVKRPTGGNGELTTSEVIYGYMVALNIPFECQKWHLNRLLTLIRVCGEQQAPKSKMPMKNVASQNAALNAARKARMNTRG